MNMAVSVNNVSKHFYQWKKKPLNGNRLQRIFPDLFLEKKKFTAVDNISFTIKQGEIFGVLGANGSGKSTLIRLIATLLYPDSGYIQVFGKCAVKDDKDVRRMINRVSVEASFFKKLSAWENLAFAARLYGFTLSKQRKVLEDIFKRLDLSESKLNESLENLSRGMQQKVAIARALFTDPSLLLLDEPTTGLDPKSKKQVQAFVKEINQERGTTTLLTTHDMNEAETLCHRLVIMKDGKIVASGTPQELKKLKTNGNGKSQEAVTLEEVFLAIAEESCV